MFLSCKMNNNENTLLTMHVSLLLCIVCATQVYNYMDNTKELHKSHDYATLTDILRNSLVEM